MATSDSTFLNLDGQPQLLKIETGWALVSSVKGYPGYFADTSGNIYSSWTPVRGGARSNPANIKRLKPSPKRHGYLALTLARDGIHHTLYVHQIVMLAFVGDCPPGLEICHWDGNKANNALSNLRYDTPKGNKADNKRSRCGNIGERNNTTKLKEYQVHEIRRLIAAGEPDSRIARRYGISRNGIYSIRMKQSWGWLPEQPEGVGADE